MKILVDAMGGDNAPNEIIKGVVEAADNVKGEIVLIGDEKIIKEQLAQYDKKDNIVIKHASEVITNEDTPTKAIKEKKDSSMNVGFKMLHDKEGDVFISAGNTGAIMTGALLITGRIKGVHRPALCPILPSETGKFLMIDCGANTNCKPDYLVQFAKMANIYMTRTMGVSNPKIGLVNIGAEEGKGNDLTKATYDLLKKANLNFVGNVEARDLVAGKVDIAVCDGFTGNVILKTMEGMGVAVFNILKEQIQQSLKSKIGALLMKPALRGIKHKMDYSEYGGGLLLGIDGAVVKCHGTSKAKTIKNAVLQAYDFANNGVVEAIRKEIKE